MQTPDRNRIISGRLSLEEQHDHWIRTGEQVAYRAWLSSWKPNLFVTLVPQGRGLNARNMHAIATRWCNRVLSEFAPRNPRRKPGRFAILIESDAGVGWHAHGIGCVPGSSIEKVVGSSQEWLDEEFDAYLLHNLPLRPGFERRHSPSAAVREIDPDQDAESVIRYSTKLWSSQGKSEYLLLSGFHSLQA